MPAPVHRPKPAPAKPSRDPVALTIEERSRLFRILDTLKHMKGSLLRGEDSLPVTRACVETLGSDAVYLLESLPGFDQIKTS